MSFSSVRPMTSDARSSGNSVPARSVVSTNIRRAARRPRSDRGPTRRARESGSSAAPRTPQGPADDRSPGRQRPAAAAGGLRRAPRPAAAGRGRRRGRGQRLRGGRGERLRLRRAAPPRRRRPWGGIGTAGEPGGVSTGSARASIPARSRSRAAPCRRGRPRWARRGAPGAATRRGGLRRHRGDRGARRYRDRPAHRPHRRGHRGDVRHRRPSPIADAAERGGGALAAQRDAIVADLDLVAFAQRRRASRSSCR